MAESLFTDGEVLSASKLNEIEELLEFSYDPIKAPPEATYGPYTPTVWTAGDIVTEEKLNKMAAAIAYIYEEYPPPGFTYTPVTWATGDVVTAEKLNAMADDYWQRMNNPPDPGPF